MTEQLVREQADGMIDRWINLAALAKQTPVWLPMSQAPASILLPSTLL